MAGRDFVLQHFVSRAQLWGTCGCDSSHFLLGTKAPVGAESAVPVGVSSPPLFPVGGGEPPPFTSHAVLHKLSLKRAAKCLHLIL